MKQSKRNKRNAALKAEKKAEGKPAFSRYERKVQRGFREALSGTPARHLLGTYNPNSQDV